MKSETTPQEIAQTATIVQPVAIYTRVSTENQESEGTSLDTQRQACLKYSQEHGYKAIRQFAETASGLTLDRPQLDELRVLVRNEDISGVVIYCLDRLSRDPTHGVILTQELEKHNVTLEAVTETIDSSELGKLISYIRGFAAKLETEKIKERTQRGIRARVFDKGLPVTYRQPFGYSWDKENKRLVPNSDYDTVKLILGLAIEGKSYDYIIADLKRRGIPSPTGLPEWNKHTISTIMRNPVYAGRYHAFKSEAIEPKKRNGRTNGKSSVKRLPQDQWHYIPEIEVVTPLMTLDQRALLLGQLQKRQKTAKRHAKRDYLLRGMVFCEAHWGKKGNPRCYHGIPKRDVWYYACPVGGCAVPYVKGWFLDSEVKSLVAMILGKAPDSCFEKMRKEIYNTELRKQLERELCNLQKKREKSLRNEAMLEDRHINGQISQASYGILKEKYQKEREWLKKEQEAKLDELAQLGREAEAIASIEQIRKEADKELDDLTIEEWRELLIKLNVSVLFKIDGTMSIEVGIPYLPLPEGAIPDFPQAKGIGLASPERG